MRRTHHSEAIAARRRRVLRLLAAIASLLLLALTQPGPAAASPAQLQHREWWIGALGLPKVWQITKGKAVTVAVVDDGVDATVGDLHGALVPGFTVKGSSGSPDADHTPEGHGTSMAIHIAGRGTDPGILGVAPQAKILPVYLPDGNADTVNVLDRLSAMSHPPQIVNMSYGTGGSCPDDLQAAVAKAVGKGMILVAAAGNEGNTSNQSQYPSNCKGVVAIGAFDSTGKAWADTQRQPYVSLGGPGVDIVTYNHAHTTGTSDGTSDATAIVSGEFALLRAHFKTMSSRQLVARMLATASKSLYHGPGYGKKGDTLGFGPGLVHHALTDHVAADAPNPVYDALAKIAPQPSKSASPTPAASNDTPTSEPTGDVGASFPGGNDSASSSSGNGAVIGVVAAVVVVLILVVGLFLYRRRRAVHSGPGNPFPPAAGGP